MKKTLILLFLGFTALGISSPVWADGMMVSAPSYIVRETAQQAIIRHDGQIESLSILPSFRSNAHEFAWVIPLPAIPTIETGSLDLFYDLDRLTSPKYRQRDGDWDGCNKHDADYLIGAPNDVQIYHQQMVGYYQTMVVESDDSEALVDSLTAWGFLHDQNLEQVSDLIESYVLDDWSFAAVKVDSAAFAEAFPYDTEYYYGNLEPLKFTFDSQEMIYPMRISALSAGESSDVILYVLADHRMTYDGAVTRYANRFTEEEINSLNHRDSAREFLQPGEFLTHLRRSFSPDEMSEDIVLERADSDDEFLLIYYSGLPWMTLIFLGPAVLWGFYRRFVAAR